MCITVFLLYSQLDIVQQEYIYEAGLDQFEVVKAVFDVKGSWLATVEERGRESSDLEFFSNCGLSMRQRKGIHASME